MCFAFFRDWKKWSSALTSYYIGPLFSRNEICWHKFGAREHSEAWCKSQRGYQWGIAPGVHERQNLETCHVYVPDATNLAAFILIVASGIFRWEIFICLGVPGNIVLYYPLTELPPTLLLSYYFYNNCATAIYFLSAGLKARLTFFRHNFPFHNK